MAILVTLSNIDCDDDADGEMGKFCGQKSSGGRFSPQHKASNKKFRFDELWRLGFRVREGLDLSRGGILERFF